jgi:hypothetical protein
VANTVRIGTQVTGVKAASSDLDKLRDKFDRLQKQGAKGFMTGVGAGVGIAAFNALGQAASMAGDALGGAIRAAAEEETSIARLGTALEANVKSWDGNTKAIEETIAARMKLGFSDDEQRDSLALLVAKTGNVTEALEIQSAAMDLARLKGIGLAEASKAIALGMSGSGRALKELGINVAEMTDKTQVLGAIQEKAGGQAKAYGETTSGAMLAAQVAIDEASETIGEKLLPVMKDAAFFVRDNVVPAVELLSDAFGFLGDVINPAGTQLEYVRAEFERQQAVADAAAKAVADAALSWDTIGEKAAASREPVASGVAGLNTATDAAAGLTSQLDSARASWDALQARVKANDEFVNLPDRIIVAAGDVAAAQDELGAAIDTGNEVAIAAARIRLREAQSALAALRTEYARLRAAMEKPFTLGPINWRTPPTDRNLDRSAAGGPASGVTLVGENGPELVNLPAGTMVNPSAAAGLAGMGQSVPRGGSDALLAEARLTNALLARLTAQEPNAARPQTARGDLARQAALMPGGRL